MSNVCSTGGISPYPKPEKREPEYMHVAVGV